MKFVVGMENQSLKVYNKSRKYIRGLINRVSSHYETEVTYDGILSIKIGGRKNAKKKAC